MLNIQKKMSNTFLALLRIARYCSWFCFVYSNRSTELDPFK